MTTSPSKAATRVARDDGYGRSSRFYEVNGQKLPSVTTILNVINKPALVNWAAKTERELVLEAAANLYEDLPLDGPKMSRAAYHATLQARLGKQKAHVKELAKAAEIGSQTHALIEWNLRKDLGQLVGPEPVIAPEATWAFMAYEDWRKQSHLVPQAIEQTVFSLVHGYAGTMDWSGYVDGVMSVGDWKTGKAIYAEAMLQNTAYVHALIEMQHLTPPVQGVIVRLPKVSTDPEFEVQVIPWSKLQDLFTVFLAVRDLWRWQEQENAERSAK